MTGPANHSTQAVRIEAMQPGDVEAVAALARKIWYAHYPAIIGTAQIEYMLGQRYSLEVMRGELQQRDLWWDTLTVGDTLAGFASYFRVPGSTDMKLDKLYVHPDHQRRGFGGRMVERACQVAAANGCRRLVLAVNKGNRSAIASYLKHGFRIAEAAVKDIGGGFVMDDYIMVKPVTRDR